MKGRRNQKLNGGFRRRLVAQGKLHCLAKLTVYVHIRHVCDGLYASWRVKATLRYRFKTLDRKPRPPKPIRSQSYIGPTTVGDNVCVLCEARFLGSNPGEVHFFFVWFFFFLHTRECNSIGRCCLRSVMNVHSWFY